MTDVLPFPVPSPATPENAAFTGQIPNPSMYAERQSQWKGRRGKPRCDHCRAHNLKCDRVLPTCNHCAWAHRECKYTPLPTPAHRGIPRCDRCRFHNLKCDRSLPVCNNCQHDADTDCNYTPKKRHKVPADHIGQASAERPIHNTYTATAKSASFLVSDAPPPNKYPTNNNWIAEHPDIGPKGKLPASMYELSSNSGSDDGDDDEIVEIESPYPPTVASSAPPPHESRHSYDTWAKSRPPPQPSQPPPPSQPALPPQPSAPIRASSGSASAPGPSGKSRVYDPRHLEPWYHAHFAPLPRVILQGIRTVNPGDMPTRRDFDTALIQFVAELSPDLREIAVFPPESYSAIAMALKKDGLNDLPKRTSGWVGYHHVRPGSRKFNLLVVPREDHFNMSSDKEETLLSAYMADVDGEPHKVAAAGSSAQEGLSAFMRIPVSPQIYDVLVYAHKKHPSTIGTLVEARNAGVSCITWPMVEIFYRLCPRCMAKNKS